MSFTETEKVNIRRFCGYQVFGSEANPNWGDRYFTQYGLLEFRMNNMTSEEEIVVRTVYLANLITLESQIPLVSANLDTDKAAVWTHNKNEHRDRETLFASWRLKLCSFIGVEPGKGLQNLNNIPVVI